MVSSTSRAAHLLERKAFIPSARREVLHLATPVLRPFQRAPRTPLDTFQQLFRNTLLFATESIARPSDLIDPASLLVDAASRLVLCGQGPRHTTADSSSTPATFIASYRSIKQATCHRASEA